MKCVETLYILPDIDTTGIRSAIRLGLQYLISVLSGYLNLSVNIKTIVAKPGKISGITLNYIRNERIFKN
ncbi:MAG: hypothetical protein ACLU30_16975 [Odoribacter splanchnicus]